MRDYCSGVLTEGPISTDTFDGLAMSYMKSPEFWELKPSSQATYRRAIETLRQLFGEMRVEDITRRQVIELRNALQSKPGKCKITLKVMAVVMAAALDMGIIFVNPAVKLRLPEGGEYQAWPDPALDLFRIRAPAKVVWGLELGVYTGQRRGDVIAMRWDAWDGEGINVVQQKTGAEVWIPVHPELAGVLHDIPRRSLHILTSKKGRVWTPGAFSSAFRRATLNLGLGDYQFHGLRKTAASKLAEAGCSTEQIKAITGHTTDSMVAHYVKGADQKRLARDAMDKWRG